MQRIENLNQWPAELIQVLAGAESLVVLTGAGVSAESGIPTFRDAQTGLWKKHDPMQLASPQGFRRDPATVWDWYQWRRKLIAECSPNAGHVALAELERQFTSFTLITQNVDGFHQLAGSRQVLELHGNIRHSICSLTRKPIDPGWLDAHADQRPPVSPHHAKGLARPDVVWFGEALDARILNQSFAAASTCDLMLIVGTAGTVHPAASLPLAARDGGATLIDINPETSVLSPMCHWHLAGPSALCLPALLKQLTEKRGRHL